MRLENRRHIAERARFDLLIGVPSDWRLHDIKKVGTVIQSPGGDYLILKLNMFPRQAYFIKPNFDRRTGLTVFSQIVHTDMGLRFLRPIGTVRPHRTLKTYLELKILVLPTSFFLSAFSLHYVHSFKI